MRFMKLRGGKVIGDGMKPYIVAELNSSHNGKVEIAKQMIDAAKDCGCDCVKFQSWSADSLYADEYYKNNPISKRIVAKFSLTPDQLLELSAYCKEVGIDFSSTPYSKEEVDFLAEKTEAPFIKIASMEINNLPFLKYIGEKGIPIVLSTGMSTIEEIREAVKAIESTGNRQLCILLASPANSILIAGAKLGILLLIIKKSSTFTPTNRASIFTIKWKSQSSSPSITALMWWAPHSTV